MASSERWVQSFTSGLEPCGDDHNKKAPANQFQVLKAGKAEAK